MCYNPGNCKTEEQLREEEEKDAKFWGEKVGWRKRASERCARKVLKRNVPIPKKPQSVSNDLELFDLIATIVKKIKNKKISQEALRKFVGE